MAFGNSSPPGCKILSPTCNPEILATIAESRKKTPVVVMLVIVYCFGRVASRNIIRLGSTDVGFFVVSGTSCAFALMREV